MAKKETKKQKKDREIYIKQGGHTLVLKKGLVTEKQAAIIAMEMLEDGRQQFGIRRVKNANKNKS